MKNLKNKIKGFTLIELLVVIAIIGLLASMVLVAVATARVKAKDARIRADLAQLRTLEEAASDGTYRALAGTDTGYTQLTTDINTQKAQTVGFGLAAGTAWCASAALNSTSAPTNWCVDTAGWSASGACGAATGVCT